MTKYKICVKCNKSKDLADFEVVYPNKNNYLINPSYRNKCKKCKIEENKERIRKDPDFYKKQYAALSEEERKEYIKYKSKINSMRPNIVQKRKEYNSSDVGIYNRYRNESKRRNRKIRNISVDLTFDEFSKLINSPCNYCGKPNCRGVDRIDSSKSYILENSVPCCKICNQMKSDLILEEFMDHISKILKHRMESL